MQDWPRHGHAAVGAGVLRKSPNAQLDHAKRLLADPRTTMMEVAASLHVDRTTLYRALVRERDASTGVRSTGAK
jgi:hypothetical protein